MAKKNIPWHGGEYWIQWLAMASFDRNHECKQTIRRLVGIRFLGTALVCAHRRLWNREEDLNKGFTTM
jgi:hypothetical protein